jgi:DoxX-like family
MIKLIGLLKVLAAIGLILHMVPGIAPVFVPLAAVSLVLLMIGAAITHTLHKENQAGAMNVVLLILAAVLAWGRFGPYSF